MGFARVPSFKFAMKLANVDYSVMTDAQKTSLKEKAKAMVKLKIDAAARRLAGSPAPAAAAAPEPAGAYQISVTYVIVFNVII